MNTYLRVLAHSMLLIAVSRASASVVYYFEYDEWAAAAGTSVTEIDFTGFVPGQYISGEYSELGMTISPGATVVNYGDLFVDDWGIEGFHNPGDRFTIELDAPRNAFANLSPGSEQFVFRRGDEVIYSSPFFGNGFVGFVSDEPFDSIEFTDAALSDNLWYGAPIPAPGVLALLMMFGLTRRRRVRG